MVINHSWKVEEEKGVLCVGLLCLDIISVCEDYPAEGTDQHCKSSRWQKGGNAANTSAVLGILGQKVECLGTVSAQAEGTSDRILMNFVESEMKRCNVLMDNVVRIPQSCCPTSHVLVNMKNGSRTIIHNRKDLPELSFTHFSSVDLASYSLIHFEGRNVKEVLPMIDRVDEYNKKVGDDSKKILISVELEKARIPILHQMLPKADLVVISQDYAEKNGYVNAVAAVEGYKALTKSGAFIVCAWGASGAASGVCGSSDDVIMTPAFSPDAVVDTLGAGDTFLGGLIFSLLRGRILSASVKFACHVAGHKVSSDGYDHIRDLNHDSILSS